MTQHTNFFSTRLDALQQRVAKAGVEVQTAVDETDAQLVERINSAQADLDQSVKNAKQETRRPPTARRPSGRSSRPTPRPSAARPRRTWTSASCTWTPASPRPTRTGQKADAAEALDFADWSVGNAQLSVLDAVHARAYADRLKAADTKQSPPSWCTTPSSAQPQLRRRGQDTQRPARPAPPKRKL